MSKKTVTLEQLLESARKSEELSVQVAQAVQAELEKRPTSTEVNEAMDRLFTSVSDGKSLIASAITDKGVATAADASFQTMRENILAIESGGGLPEGVYQINVSASTAEGGTVSGGGSVEEGQSVTLTQTTADGYSFSGWYSGSTLLSTASPYTFTPTGNITVTAKFAAIPVYTVTATIDPAGSGTVTGAGQYQEGAQATITATSAEGYTFSGWTENGTTVSTSESYTFTVTGNMAFVAGFVARETHNLPEGYTEVEYIESTSTCYVSIGLKINYATTILELDIEPKNYNEKEEYFFSVSGGSNNYVNVSRRSENVMSYRYYGAYAKQFEKNVSNQRIRVVYDGPSKEIRIGDSAFGIVTNNSTTQYNATIFSYSSGSVSRSPISFLYGATLETGGTMMGHFVPCINPSGVAGLYDIIRNKFYGNAGTGTFIAGPAV